MQDFRGGKKSCNRKLVVPGCCAPPAIQFCQAARRVIVRLLDARVSSIEFFSCQMQMHLFDLRNIMGDLKHASYFKCEAQACFSPTNKSRCLLHSHHETRSKCGYCRSHVLNDKTCILSLILLRKSAKLTSPHWCLIIAQNLTLLSYLMKDIHLHDWVCDEIIN